MLGQRKINGWEKTFFNGKAYIQFGLKFNNSNDLKIAIEKIKKCTAGFYHSTDGDNMYRFKDDPIVYKLPNNITNLTDLCNYMYQNHTRPLDQTLASIGANNDSLVLNINHMACDGGYIKNLFEYLKTDKIIDKIPSIIPLDEVFKNEIKSYKGELPPVPPFDFDVTRVFPKHKEDLHYTGTTKMVDLQSNEKEFMTYKLNGRIKNLTDYYWANYILGLSAYNNKFDKAGIITCINTRQFLKKDSIDYANNFSQIRVRAPHITVDDTVGELMKQMRNDFNERVKRGEMWAGLKAMKISHLNPAQTEKPNEKDIGCSGDLSLIGTFDPENKFKDVWVNFHMSENELKHFTGYLSFSVIRNGVNTIYGKFRTGTNYFSEKDAEIVGNSIQYGMKTIHPQMKIAEALDILKDYQKKKEISLE